MQNYVKIRGCLDSILNDIFKGESPSPLKVFVPKFNKPNISYEKYNKKKGVYYKINSYSVKIFLQRNYGVDLDCLIEKAKEMSHDIKDNPIPGNIENEIDRPVIIPSKKSNLPKLNYQSIEKEIANFVEYVNRVIHKYHQFEVCTIKAIKLLKRAYKINEEIELENREKENNLKLEPFDKTLVAINTKIKSLSYLMGKSKDIISKAKYKKEIKGLKLKLVENTKDFELQVEKNAKQVDGIFKKYKIIYQWLSSGFDHNPVSDVNAKLHKLGILLKEKNCDDKEKEEIMKYISITMEYADLSKSLSKVHDLAYKDILRFCKDYVSNFDKLGNILENKNNMAEQWLKDITITFKDLSILFKFPLKIDMIDIENKKIISFQSLISACKIYKEDIARQKKQKASSFLKRWANVSNL
jgi:hypothetical protein